MSTLYLLIYSGQAYSVVQPLSRKVYNPYHLSIEVALKGSINVNC
jgi:hypothetical protein